MFNLCLCENSFQVTQLMLNVGVEFPSMNPKVRAAPETGSSLCQDVSDPALKPNLFVVLVFPCGAP